MRCLRTRNEGKVIGREGEEGARGRSETESAKLKEEDH